MEVPGELIHFKYILCVMLVVNIPFIMYVQISNGYYFSCLALFRSSLVVIVNMLSSQFNLVISKQMRAFQVLEFFSWQRSPPQHLSQTPYFMLVRLNTMLGTENEPGIMARVLSDLF